MLNKNPKVIRMTNLEYEIINGEAVKMNAERINLHLQGYQNENHDKIIVNNEQIIDDNLHFPHLKGEDIVSENNMNILFQELKTDMREREERSRRENTEREERFLKQMEQFSIEAKERENRYREEAKDREERFREEAKDRELRFSKTVNEIKDDFKETKNELLETSKYIKSLSITTIAAMVAITAAIAGIVISIFLSSS